MRIFKDVVSYTKDLTDLVWNYIRHHSDYPGKARLCVQPDVMANVIDNPADCRQCDVYDLQLLIRRDENGREEPNAVAIDRLANRYYGLIG